MNTATMESVRRSLIRLDELSEDTITLLNAEIDGENELILLLRRGERVAAWYNICPHAGRRLDYAPGKFLRDNQGQLICAAHGATFDLNEGLCVAGPCRGEHLRAIAVTVDEHGGVYLS